MPSTPRRARATAAPSSRRHRRLHRNCLPPKPPADPLKELLALGEKHFATLADYPEARAFWWPRFVRIAQWFAQWDSARRAGITTLHAEIRGELKFPVGKREFTLVGHRRPHRAAQGRQLRHRRLQDRRRRAPRSRCAPGLAPQLTLEAAILRGGGFQTLRARLGVRDRLRHAERRRAGRQAERDQLQGRHARQPGRPRAGAAEGAGRDASRTQPRPISRSCIRCGRRITATTTTSRASRNGRSPAAATREARSEHAALSSSVRAASHLPSPRERCERVSEASAEPGERLCNARSGPLTRSASLAQC